MIDSDNVEANTRRIEVIRKCFRPVTFVFFNRKYSFVFCVAYSFLSLIAEVKLHWIGFFSASGAIISLAGLFLNIKLSLRFHLNLPVRNLVNIINGSFGFGVSEVTKEHERRVNEVLLDEIFGVAFMIMGTIIWAYGSYLVAALT